MRIATRSAGLAFVLTLAGLLASTPARAQTIPHPNPHAERDEAFVVHRRDVRKLPEPLKHRLGEMAENPHSFLPLQPFNEADKPSQLFQYYLLDTGGFEPNVLTHIFPGINDHTQLTATGPNGGIPTIGAVRVVIEPKPGLPTDPNDVRAFNDVFTDISGLFVINNESGWYEGWMIHDLTVPAVSNTLRPDGHALFGKLAPADATALAALGTGHDVPGALFTMDGNAVHLPRPSDRFPDKQTNVVPIHVSMGTFNALQQSDIHAYWEFNYTGTNWVHPLYELPFTGGIPGTFESGKVGALQSIVPGPGPAGTPNDPKVYGDNPNAPRDPDRFEGDDADEEAGDAQREFRYRNVPSGLANEIFLDTYERIASFEPGVPFPQRLYDAYAAEVARVDQNGDGVISSLEGDVDSASDGFEDNARLYLPPTVFDRFAVTREINDGLIAPRFAPSQRAWVLSGMRVPVNPTVPASVGRDGDDR